MYKEASHRIAATVDLEWGRRYAGLANYHERIHSSLGICANIAMIEAKGRVSILERLRLCMRDRFRRATGFASCLSSSPQYLRAVEATRPTSRSFAKGSSD